MTSTLKEENGSIAEQRDRHVLYQKSVQDTESDIEFLVEKYKEIKKRDPRSLREDFCGTALLAVDWCKEHSDNIAVGVDFCADTLAWGQKHNIDTADKEVGSRVQLVKEDVLKYYNSDKLVDIVCAYNFSYNIFKTRNQLVDYFKNARKGLNDEGMLVLDVFGGTEAYKEIEEAREVDDEDFDYLWEQEKFNPITHEMVCHIHFVFEDDSVMEKAFTYEWRLRTLPELIESLHEAGYSKVRCFWEKYEEAEEDDDDGENDDDETYLEGTGEYYETTEVETQESYIAYLIAEK